MAEKKKSFGSNEVFAAVAREGAMFLGAPKTEPKKTAPKKKKSAKKKSR